MITTQKNKNRQITYTLVHTRAPELLRMYHKNITTNHRVRRAANISMPSLVTRAKLIVAQRTFIPVATQKVDT